MTQLPNTLAAARAIAERRVKRKALAIANDATRMAPVYSGALQQNIRAYSIGKGHWRVGVDSHIDYAPFVEFGTRYNRAQPFLRPALEANRS